MNKVIKEKKGPQKVHKVLHPLSRKAKKMTAEGIRDIKKEKEASIRRKELKPIKQLLDYCQNKIKTEGKKQYTEIEMSAMIDEYLQNNVPEEEEAHQISSRSNVVSKVKTLYDIEVSDFKSHGYSAPDLTKTNNIKFLINWDGDMKYFNPNMMKKFKYIEQVVQNQMETTA